MAAAATVLAAFGNVDVYVPEGINVDVSGISLFGHRRDWALEADRPDVPTIHVRALSSGCPSGYGPVADRVR
jgi:hypothetical protein